MPPFDENPAILPIETSIDALSIDEISGWAMDPADPTRRIRLELLVDGQVAWCGLANEYRQDLAAAGIGDGRCGFFIRPLRAVLPGAISLVRLRDADTGLDVPEATALLVDELADFDNFAGHALAVMVANAAAHATQAAALDPLLSTLVRAVQDLAQARQALAGRRADGDDALDRMLGGLPRLHLEAVAAPEVSIIIPVHNKYELTHACLTSMLEHLPEASFEVIIVDDASTDETLLAGLALSGGLRVLRNAANLGFVGSCNAGAAAARGRKLFFLNNDTLVRPGWLDELVATFGYDPRIGIVGSRLMFPDGSLQEVGGIIWRMGDGWNWGRNGDAQEPRFSHLRDADYVSGAALMIDRGVFEALGNFDTLYAPAYYEDTDLCFRVRAAGWRVVVQPASEIIHLEGQSNGTDVNGPGLKRYQKLNLRKFRDRWATTLAGHRINGQMPELEAERGVRKRALFIDDVVPMPDRDAGSNAAFQHMLLLQRLGHKVTFVPADNMASIAPYTGALQKRGIECLHHPHFFSVEEIFRRNAQQPDLVYIHRYSNASKYMGMVRQHLPNARILYNVADLHFLRLERQAALQQDPVLAAQAARMRRDELAMIAAADCCIVHSVAEATLLGQVVPGARVAVVPWPVQPNPTTIPFAERRGTAFLGGFNHPPNVDAVEWLGGEIRPLLDGVPVSIYGSAVTPVIQAQDRGEFRVVGHVPLLADALHPHRSTVAPLRYGAGIKGKVLDSFAHGLPCVMTAIAAEGIGLTGDLTWLVADDAPAIAEKLLRLEQDEAWNATLSAAALAFMTEHFGAARLADALAVAIEMSVPPG